MAQLYSLELEKQFLSGLLLNSHCRPEVSEITPADLSETNAVVLRAIDACLAGDSPFSTFLVANTLSSLGARIGSVLEPGLYLKSLEGLAVGEKALIGVARDLKRWSIRREMHLTGIKIAKLTEQDSSKKAADLVAEVTEVFNHKVNILAGSGDQEPRDLFGTVGDFLSSETCYDTRSILTPFPTYNDLYGSWDPGNLYCYASRMKVGKSTFWLSALQQLAAADKSDQFRALVLDTELTTEENQSRSLSSVSGVKEYFIRHKLYRKDPQMRKRVEQAEQYLAPLAGRVAHRYVGGMELNQQLTIARRWAFKQLKKGKRGLIVLDYFKLNSSSDFQTKARDITLGAKVDAYKNLAKELEVPAVAFVQTNRENEDSKGGGKMVNSSVIAGGDMLAQFAAVVMLLDKLDPQERTRLCPDQSVAFTHRLLPIATRQLGPDLMGKNRLIRYQETNPHSKRAVNRTVENHLLLNFDSFRVSECECSTFGDLIERQKVLGIPVAPPPTEDAPQPEVL